MKTDYQNWKEEEDTGSPIRMQKCRERCLGKLPYRDLAAGQQIPFPIIPVTLRQANGSLERLGPREAKSCKLTEQFDAN
ncbi:hypothetical protein FK515_30215 [Klebsiella pneumoniae]|nr:hypothetical protein [Klebsiella pneumoniae]